MRLLVSMGLRPGGRRRAPLQPRLREVDLATGRVRRELGWQTPVALTSGIGADQEFTAGCPDGDRWLQPTLTEVLVVDLALFRVVRSWSHRFLHAVHAVAPRAAGGWWVACAGNDAILEVDEAGEVRAVHALDDRPTEAAWGAIPDFRRLHHDALKPHRHHPNHVTEAGGRTWVTCFETRSAVALGPPRLEIPLPEGFPHDGVPRGGLLWFTTVTGHVIAVDPITLRREVHLDLNAVVGQTGLLGWCRGVDLVGSRLFVGMSALRVARHREVARWLLHGESGKKLPTRVLEIDLDGPRLVREIPLGNAAGGTIYRVHLLGPGSVAPGSRGRGGARPA